MPKLFSKNNVYINKIDCPDNKTTEDLGRYISDQMNEIQNKIDSNNND